MPDEQTLATILTICKLMKLSGNGVKTAVGAKEARAIPQAPLAKERSSG
jgi:hypothetical protein